MIVKRLNIIILLFASVVFSAEQVEFAAESRILVYSNWETQVTHLNLPEISEIETSETLAIRNDDYTILEKAKFESFELLENLNFDTAWASFYFRPTNQNPTNSQDKEIPWDFDLGASISTTTSGSDQKPLTRVLADTNIRISNQNREIAEAWKVNIQREQSIPTSLNTIKNYINLPPPKA